MGESAAGSGGWGAGTGRPAQLRRVDQGISGSWGAVLKLCEGKSPFYPLHLLFCPQDLLSNSILPDLDIDRWYFFCLYLDLSKCPVDHLLTLGCLILGVLPEHLVN